MIRGGATASRGGRFAAVALMMVATAALVGPDRALAQGAGASASASTGAPQAPQSLTLDQALALARQNSPELSSAAAVTGAAHAARLEARSGLLPDSSYSGGYTYTQPTEAHSTSPGFIAANGVREYFHQADVRQQVGVAEIAAYRSAAAGEDIARALGEIAARGLVVTVVQRFDAVVVAQRKAATAQQAVDDATRFLTITEDRERGGEAAHADVIKAQIQLEQRQRELTDANLAVETSKDDLSILVFVNYGTPFTVVDDLTPAAPLPTFDVIRTQAVRQNPDLAVADAALRQASQDVWVARGQLLPSLGIDFLYGIDASRLTRQNLGYQFTASVSVPLWTWGATEAQIAAARLRQQGARIERAFAARQLLANIHSFYAEAQAAQSELASLERSASLAADSLRLTTLRYQAGEATVLEVVDAQATLVDARNAYDDGQARYHLALASLQRLTGTFP
jgi:outer membrane protein